MPVMKECHGETQIGVCKSKRHPVAIQEDVIHMRAELNVFFLLCQIDMLVMVKVVEML